MCVDSSDLGPLGFALGGLTGMKIGGDIMAGNAKADAEQINANNVRAAGYMNENLQRDKDRQKMANQVAVLSARGASISSGTPLAALKESSRASELDALQIRTNANNQAASYEFQSQSTRAAIPFTVAGDLLDSASKMASLGMV